VFPKGRKRAQGSQQQTRGYPALNEGEKTLRFYPTSVDPEREDLLGGNHVSSAKKKEETREDFQAWEKRWVWCVSKRRNWEKGRVVYLLHKQKAERKYLIFSRKKGRPKT